MKSVLLGLALAGATVVTPGTWRVEQGAVRVICPITIGGSFEAKTTALSGSVTLDTGIGLRNEHLRENYLEVGKGAGFDTATLSEIDLNGLNPDALEGKGSFTGVLSLHGVSKAVTGAVDIRQSGAGLRVKASFPVQLSDYSIRPPRYLGVGVKNIVQVEVAFAVSR